MASTVSADALALQRLYHWESIAPDRVALTQPLALLMLNVEAVKKASDSTGRGELESSLVQHLKGINELLDPHEQLDCLVVMTEAWTVDNDLITPTFKVKRNRIEDLFAKNYDQWVGMRKKVIWHSPA